MQISCSSDAFGLVVISKLKHGKMSTTPQPASLPKKSVSFASGDSRRSSQALSSEVFYLLFSTDAIWLTVAEVVCSQNKKVHCNKLLQKVASIYVL